MADAGILGVECSVCMNRPVQVNAVFHEHVAVAWLTLAWNLVLALALVLGCIDSTYWHKLSIEACRMLMYRCHTVSRCVS